MKPWRPSSPNTSFPKVGVAGLAGKPGEGKSGIVLPHCVEGEMFRETKLLDNRLSPSSKRFDQVLSKFANMVMIEGMKAVEDATAATKESFEIESIRLAQINSEALRDRDSSIRQLTRELEEARKRSKTLTTHLMRLASRLSHGSHFPFTVAQTFHLWRSKVFPSSNIHHQFHRSKVLMRLLYRWRIESLNDSWKRKRAAALRTQADQHKCAVQSLENENTTLKSEIESLELKLREEVTKRDSFQMQLRRFVDTSIEDTKPLTARTSPSPPLVSQACKLSNRPPRSKSCKPM